MPWGHTGPKAEGDGDQTAPAFDHPSTQIGGELEARLSKDGLLLAPGTSGTIDLAGSQPHLERAARRGSVGIPSGNVAVRRAVDARFRSAGRRAGPGAVLDIRPGGR